MKVHITSILVVSCLTVAECWQDGEIGGTALAEGPAGPAATVSASQPASAVVVEGGAARLLETVGQDAQPLMEKIDGGMIDWANGHVLAIGTCKVNGPNQSDIAMAGRGAMLVAARNAALMLAGLKVDAKGRFEQVECGQVNVDAVLKNFRADAPVYNKNDGTVSVSIRLPMYGAAGLVRVNCAIAGCVKWNWQANKLAATVPAVIIIDARGCGVMPCVRSAIITVSGKILLDAGELSGACGGPAVVFARAGREGKELVISSREAIVIKAQRANAQQCGLVVLSDEQVQKLPAQAKDVMIEGKVVIVSESVGGN